MLAGQDMIRRHNAFSVSIRLGAYGAHTLCHAKNVFTSSLLGNPSRSSRRTLFWLSLESLSISKGGWCPMGYTH